MKKLLILLFLVLVSFAPPQKRNSFDVATQLTNIIGANITKVTPKIEKLFNEHRKLRYYELQKEPESKFLTYSPMSFCFICKCNTCGCIVTQGACKTYPGACGTCPCCYGSMSAWVMSCPGGMCGNIQGAN